MNNFDQPITTNTRRNKIIKYSIASLLLLAIIYSIGIKAEQALPGSGLYPIKKLNEGIMEMLTFSHPNRAKTHIEIAERRLMEFEKTIATNTFSRETVTSVSENLNNHINAAIAHIQNIHTDGNSEQALAIATTFEAVLDAHAEILESVDDNLSDEDTAIVDIIINIVQLQRNIVKDTAKEIDDILDEQGRAMRASEPRVVEKEPITATTTLSR
jgi:hypothetical protein